MEASTATTCYRHPNRETGVSCSSCGRPICPDCMTATPVGMRCPDCARQKTKVRTAATLTRDPHLAYALIAVNVIAYLATAATGSGIAGRGGSVFLNGALYGPAVEAGEWWRIVTAGFLHGGLIHLAFNMYFLYFLGTMLEPAIGKLRFAVIYFVSLVGGSFGALLLSPDAFTVGASGAVFGLMGAAIIAMRARGIDAMQSGLGITLALNLGITFLIPGISIGGHIGGLLAGGIVGLLLFEVAERRRSTLAPVLAACVGIGVALAIGCVAVAGSTAAL
ncbi:MAG TPA: rhomboid family intramembrane serine protease [Solirubrobacteraceae bacterium]|jgi:membrane associated rhomboid family serine protease|nr:rhomboid family intramembrane serine protease [Solirubrobacteraceae bacterium]